MERLSLDLTLSYSELLLSRFGEVLSCSCWEKGTVYETMTLTFEYHQPNISSLGSGVPDPEEIK
jgi:hypothetical protein